MQTKKVVLAVGAHPDDIDIGCSGTILKLIKQGYTAYYLVLTDGSKGSENPHLTNQELTKLRHGEQENAAKILGVKKVFFFDFLDGELENTPELRKQIVKLIRQIKPTTVMCWDPTLVYDAERQFINHPDHRNAGQATLDAVFPYARNTRSFPELLSEGLEPHVVEEVLMVNFTHMNHFIDITEFIELKMRSIGCHISQFQDMAKFQNRISEINADYGQTHKPKVKYAEGFYRITLRQPS